MNLIGKYPAPKRHELSTTAKFVWSYLRDRAKDGTRSFWDPLEAIADDLGLSLRAVKRATAELVERGVIARQRQGFGEANAYQILEPSKAAEQPQNIENSSVGPKMAPLDPVGPKMAPTGLSQWGHKRPLSGATGGPNESVFKLVPHTDQTQRTLPLGSSSESPTRVVPDIDLVVDAWKAMAKRAGLPVPREVTKSRRTALIARLKDQGLKQILAAIERIERSDFCRGSRGWKADIDFLLQSDSVTKVLEGKYDNTDQAKLAADRKAEAEARYVAEKIASWDKIGGAETSGSGRGRL